MIDEGELRSRYPEIPWDQPVMVTVTYEIPVSRWVCRYCIAMNGLQANQILSDAAPVFNYRDEALDHIELAHHE